MAEVTEQELLKFEKHLKEAYGWDAKYLVKTDQATARELIRHTIKSAKDLLINTPQTGEFIEAAKAEMAHHAERHGDESNKYPHDFQMVLTCLLGKVVDAIWVGDKKKYEHHLLTLAAVAGTGHKYLQAEGSKSKAWFDQKKE